MKILLDQNFPLALTRRLREEGHDAEHLIELGQRGTADVIIVKRLSAEPILFLTHEEDFLHIRSTCSAVILSRVTQTLPMSTRLEIWLKAVHEYFARERKQRFFEVFDDGKLVPWQVMGGR
jgi:predicted nuclease of predicted toxin-antitoxin system